MVADWWAGHGMPSIPKPIVPACGVIAETLDGEPLAAVWLYQDNTTPMAFMHHLVTNPKNKPRVSAAAIPVLLGGVREVCAGLGRSVVQTLVPKRSLKRYLAEAGFNESGPPETQMLMIVPTEQEAPN